MTKKIMLVEDEQDITTLLGMILDGAGYEVHSFTSPMLALKDFRPGFYDLVLLDIKMPEMDGLALAAEIHKQPSSQMLPLVMLTSIGKPQSSDESLNRHFAALLAGAAVVTPGTARTSSFTRSATRARSIDPG